MSKNNATHASRTDGLDSSLAAGSVIWDDFALEEVERHARAIKAKAEEIARRCYLPTISDYTVKMAIRELSSNAEAIHGEKGATK
jgi:hypothetical protein